MNNFEYLTTLDTIYFSYYFYNINKYFSIYYSNSDNSYSTLELKKEYKTLIGIDKVYISNYFDYFGNSCYKLKLVISSKILGDKYLENINKYNIDLVLERVVEALQGIINIKVSDFQNFTVNTVYYTKNIIDNTPYTSEEILDTINYYIDTSQQVKSKNTDYLSKGTLYLNNSKKQQTRIYNKNKELKKKKNKEFIDKFPSVLENSSNMLRVEHIIHSKESICKEFNIKKNELCNIYKILNYNSTNISYERMLHYMKKKLYLNKEEVKFEDFDIDDYNKYLLGEAYFTKFGNNLEKIKYTLENLKNTTKTSTDRAFSEKNKRELKKIKESIHFYLYYNNKKIRNYKNIVNDFLELLKHT